MTVNDREGFVHGGYVSRTQKSEERQTAAQSSDTLKPTYIRGVLIVNKGYGLPPDFAPGESREARRAFEE